MALSTRLSTVLANAMLDAVNAQANSGILRIYTGAQPATPETAATGTLLAELTLNATAFGAASGKVITANAIADDSSANATGTAGWCRIFKSDGTTALMDGTVGTASANLILNAGDIQSAARVSVTSLTITLPMQGA